MSASLAAVGGAFILLALAVPAIIRLHETGFILVAGSLIVPGWGAVGCLLVGSVCFLGLGTALAFVGWRGRAPGRIGRAVGVTSLAVVPLGAAILAVPVAMVGVGQAVSEPEWTVLAPENSRGCRVIVQQTSFLLSGSGTFYVAPPGVHVVEPSGHYRSDDGLRPFSSLDDQVAWSGDRARIILRTSGWVDTDDAHLRCR